MNKDQLFQHTLGNAFIYACLIDARAAAAIYLKDVAGEFKPAAAWHLMKAAGAFDKLQTTLCAQRSLAPFPWRMKKPEEWTPEMRLRQVDLLKEAKALDAQAILEIETALKAELLGAESS
ncbi:MAG: hypothetical protein NTX50_07315 [Candidatus Sumerlaeota bacterium]|nr:hypothetical protein [Candidatus Sumerlaeota bacterium]